MIIKCLFICFNLLTLTVLSGCEKTAEDEDVWVVGTQIGNQNMLKTGAIAYNETKSVYFTSISPMPLTSIIGNRTLVSSGDVIAEFNVRHINIEKNNLRLNCWSLKKKGTLYF